MSQLRPTKVGLETLGWQALYSGVAAGLLVFTANGVLDLDVSSVKLAALAGLVAAGHVVQQFATNKLGVLKSPTLGSDDA